MQPGQVFQVSSIIAIASMALGGFLLISGVYLRRIAEGDPNGKLGILGEPGSWVFISSFCFIASSIAGIGEMINILLSGPEEIDTPAFIQASLYFIIPGFLLLIYALFRLYSQDKRPWRMVK